MADAPAPQPDAEQQPEGEALEVQATETVATTEPPKPSQRLKLSKAS